MFYADGAVGEKFDQLKWPSDAEEAEAGSASVLCKDPFDGLTCTREAGHSGDHVAARSPSRLIAGRWTRLLYPPHREADRCPICGAMLLAAFGAEKECPNGHGAFVLAHVKVSTRKGRVVSKNCGRCGAASEGGVWCPNGCGRV